MTRFMGFQNVETYTAYDRLTRNARVEACEWLVTAKSMSNEESLTFLRERLSEALWSVADRADGKEPQGVILLAMALLEHSVQQMAHGELLVALHWHFVGQKPGDQLELFSQD